MSISATVITDSTDSSSTTTNTVSIVVPATTDFLVACIVSSGAVGVPATSVVFNGSESFTFVRRDTGAWDGVNETYTELWYLKAPTITTANAVITWPSAGNDRTQAATYVGFVGVDQSSPIGDHDGDAGSSTTAAVSLTTTVADERLIDCCLGNHADGLTVGTSGATQTARTDRVVGPGFNGMGVSTTPITSSPGSEQMEWTQTSSDWVISAMSMVPSGAGATQSSKLSGKFAGKLKGKLG